MDDIKHAREIRELVALVETRRTKIALPATIEPFEIDRWITWAKARADWLEAQSVVTLLQLRAKTLPAPRPY